MPASSPSAPLRAADAIEFAPDAATLKRAIALLADDDTAPDAGSTAHGGAVEAPQRRDALAMYGDLPVPGGRPAKNWRYDYGKLETNGLVWSSSRTPIARLPGAAKAGRLDDDASADNLSTGNAGGLFHIGANVLVPREVPNLDPRVTLLPLSDARRTHGALALGVLHRIAGPQTDRFAALATAFQNCGAFVYIPAGVQIDEPIVLVFASAPEASAVFPQIVVVLGENARATIVERHVGEGETFLCGTVEAHVSAGASLDYVIAQQTAENSRVLVSRAARCERDATASWHLAELGGGLARTILETRLQGEGARADVAALFFNTGMQHADLSTVVHHDTGHTTSQTVVRSAADDRGQGRFFGNIAIAKGAHGSDASLRDDALLLSRRAHIDSVPALEIAANDVRAFHGATVGSIDDDQLFYAQSRGIGRAEAERMIALGFFEPAVTRFPSDALRNEIRTALDAKLDEATERRQ